MNWSANSSSGSCSSFVYPDAVSDVDTTHFSVFRSGTNLDRQKRRAEHGKTIATEFPGAWYQVMNRTRFPAPSVEDILQSVSALYQIDQGNLFISRRGVFNEPRIVAINLIRLLRGETLLEARRYFGLTRYSTVNSVSSKIERLRKKDKELNRRIDSVVIFVTKSQEETWYNEKRTTKKCVRINITKK